MKFASLGEIATIERRSVRPEDICDGTIYVGLENIVSGGDLTSVGTVANGDLASSKFVFSQDHILYGKLRPYLAKIAVPDFDGVCSTDILPIRVGQDMDKMFVAHYLRQSHVVEQANGLAAGANLPRVSPTSLATIQIPMLSLLEQRRIAAILDKADELRAKRRQAVAHLDALTQSIFHSMFGDPSKAEGGRRLEELLASIDSGTSPVSEDRPAAPDEWGILKVSAVTTQTYIASENKALVNSEPNANNEVHAGDVLFTRKNTPKLIAAVAIVRHTRPKLLLPDLVFRLNIRDRTVLDPEYLGAVMAYPTKRASVQRLAGGSAASMSNISKSKLATVRIPVPSLELQQTFATRVAAVERLKETHRKHLVELDALFSSLQSRAFKGEL
ncbi:type I restriction enzyme S subunit [Paenarthrobacter nicotinovorans]|uniref:restriction endonuclease subunit S n=1 Tax=Micrococcaceae TaxID=1268 RepID=UPI000876C3DD|nr:MULTISPECIES: restriction endonuclease subunit S [Micrococcaceae]MDR6438908.1 type I restriction enzyme S subunit [Paenarthrobacter nicotinovorans]SCZ63000.1 type I restriction enzyme, S subunit [Arthrobacter sp. UNCCL28]